MTSLAEAVLVSGEALGTAALWKVLLPVTSDTVFIDPAEHPARAKARHRAAADARALVRNGNFMGQPRGN